MMTEARKKEVEEGLEKSRELFKNRKLDEAQQTIDALIDSLTDEEAVMEDDDYEYIDFKSPVEEGIYRSERDSIENEKKELREEDKVQNDDEDTDEESNKEIRLIDFPVSNMYVLSGSIAMEREDYGHALEQLGEAMDWNPINPEIAFEYAEVVKRMGSVDQFLELTKRIFPHIYTPSQLAHAYRNVAYYYESKHDADKALAMLAFSNGFEESEGAKREINAIMKDIGEESRQISSDDIKKICEDDDIPFGPDVNVIQMTGGNGLYFFDKKNYNMSKYFLTLAYNLTHAPQLKEKLDEIDKLQEKEDK